MSASVVQSKAGAENVGAATNTVTWDTPATAGNLLVVIAGSDDYVVAGGIPAGFTESAGCRQETFLGHYVWWKVAAGGETSTTYTLSGAFTSCWLTAEISGLTSSPFDISAGTLSTASGSSFTTPAIIPTAGDRWLAGSIGGSSSAEAVSGVDTWTNSFVELRDTFVTKASGTRDVAGLATRAVTGDGTTAFSTGATYSGSVTARTRTGIILAFKVAAAGGGTDATVTPAPVTATAAVLASSRSAGSTVAAAVVAAAVGILAPQIQATSNATITPAPVAATAGVAAPQVASGSSATVTAGAIATTATVGTVALSTGVRTAAAPVAASVTVPAAAISTSATVTPALVPAVAQVRPVAVTTVIADITVRVGPPRRAWAVTPPGRGWQAGPATL